MEHPEGKLGPLAIHDFAFDPTDPDNIILYEPNWHLKAGQPAAISPDLEYYDRMLFAFFEETLMEALRHVRTHVPVSFVDIPESERNSAAPIRYRPVFASADGSLAPVPAGTMSESQTVIPDLQRVLQQGHGRPIIAQKFNGEWFVATSSMLYHSPRWKTFHDFLFFYIRKLLGGEWAELDWKKPRENRHR